MCCDAPGTYNEPQKWLKRGSHSDSALQEILDQHVPSSSSPRIATAFASLYAELSGLIDDADDREATRQLVLEAFQRKPLIFCGPGVFRQAEHVLWSGSVDVSRVLGKSSIEHIYGASLQAFFVDVIGLPALNATSCWTALAELAKLEPVRNPYNEQSEDSRFELSAAVGRVYAELETYLQDDAHGTIAAIGEVRSIPSLYVSERPFTS